MEPSLRVYRQTSCLPALPAVPADTACCPCPPCLPPPPAPPAPPAGTTKVEVRRESWVSSHVRLFFCTPQTFWNDVRRGICPYEQLVCLVVDECHRWAWGRGGECWLREVVCLVVDECDGWLGRGLSEVGWWRVSATGGCTFRCSCPSCPPRRCCGRWCWGAALLVALLCWRQPCLLPCCAGGSPACCPAVLGGSPACCPALQPSPRSSTHRPTHPDRHASAPHRPAGPPATTTSSAR